MINQLNIEGSKLIYDSEELIRTILSKILNKGQYLFITSETEEGVTTEKFLISDIKRVVTVKSKTQERVEVCKLKLISDEQDKIVDNSCEEIFTWAKVISFDEETANTIHEIVCEDFSYTLTPEMDNEFNQYEEEQEIDMEDIMETEFTRILRRE